MANAFDPQQPNVCEQERLERIGAIQPFGALLGGEAGDKRIAHASANARAWLGLPDGASPLGQPLGALVPVRLSDVPAQPGHKRLLPGLVEGPRGWLDALLVNTGAGWLVELEPLSADDPLQSSQANPLLRRLFQAPQNEEELVAYASALADAVRHTTGYHRTLVYRFLPDDCGETIAESSLDAQPRYLGQRFPASDVPQIARHLYRLNTHRQIPDIAAAPEPILSLPNREADLSLSDLRAVSPVHLEYLRAMEVAASLSFSIQTGGTLWGLVACHHGCPRFLSLPVRERCVELTSGFALGVGAYQANRRLRRVAGLEGQIANLVELILGAETGLYPMSIVESAMLELFDAPGAALANDQGIHAFGSAPGPIELAAIDRWCTLQGGDGILTTDRLGSDSGLPLDAGRAAGVLAVRARLQPGQGPERRLYWFRPEQPRTVHWAGNPHKSMTLDPITGTPSPRRSFALWVETTRGCSAPWGELDLMGARMLRLMLLRGNARIG